MASFGDNLKRIRTDKNISQGELADMINMHPTHISRYERNLTKPTVDVVRKVADALKVTADELIYGDTQQKAKDKIQDNELLGMFSRVQSLKREDVTCIKSLLNAYILKTDLQLKLVH
ncbi:MAG: helix-turn-helix transcriptional regulator [Bacteroidia bacterium]|nr:helix-turn-helix transcriptional regulator [Bacteroidia bacterium]